MSVAVGSHRNDFLRYQVALRGLLDSVCEGYALNVLIPTGGDSILFKDHRVANETSLGGERGYSTPPLVKKILWCAMPLVHLTLSFNFLLLPTSRFVVFSHSQLASVLFYCLDHWQFFVMS